jgi:hypothetical protein
MVSFKAMKTALSPRVQNTNEVHVVLVKLDVLRAIALGIIVLYNITLLVMGVCVANGAWW